MFDARLGEMETIMSEHVFDVGASDGDTVNLTFDPSVHVDVWEVSSSMVDRPVVAVHHVCFFP